ncbi:MAG TPA: hypothetical protein PKH24_00155 [Sedimentisphaerales bacterium]|nr:hypothetical protein [Sedimentisphaerales bacterium]HNU27696.1 hypothetical protein [Sedimentisphaerales bacterium]
MKSLRIEPDLALRKAVRLRSALSETERFKMMVWSRRVVSTGMVAAGVVGLLMIAGCSTTAFLGRAGVPRGAKVVGGGFAIDWEAPTAGTAYLVEETSGKIIETRSLDEDETLDFDVDLSDDEVVQVFERITGVEMKKARLVLYFKPSPAEE